MKRICPLCKKNVIYKNKKSYDKALKNDPLCNSCAHLGQLPWNKNKTKKTDLTIAEYSAKLKKSWEVGKEKGRTSWNKGLTINDPRVARNTKKSTKTLLKRYKSGEIKPWNKGKSHPKVAGENSPNKRPEVRRKLREATKRNIERLCGQVSPRYNPKACQLFIEIEKEMGWNGQHAENGGELYVIGYWVDYYEPNKNVVIEYYEKGHNKTRHKKRDLIRQKEIMTYLDCQFFIIKEGEEDTWKQILNVC